MIGFIGGTGPEGRGLAVRLAVAGERVFIGSRDRDRAKTAAARVSELAASADVSAGLNAEAAANSDIVFVTVPYPAQRPTLMPLSSALEGKIVVTTVAPLVFANGVVSAVQVDEGSAALEAQADLPRSRVVAAFQTVSAHDLIDPGHTVDSDVIVCADDAEAKAAVMDLAEKIRGVRAVDGGGLRNAVYVENFTAMLLNINKTYKTRSAVRIVGI